MVLFSTDWHSPNSVDKYDCQNLNGRDAEQVHSIIYKVSCIGGGWTHVSVYEWKKIKWVEPNNVNKVIAELS